jgi:hypothetical protein
LSKVGSLTAFAAEAAIWLAGAAIVAGAAGTHWDAPSVDLGATIAQVWPGASPTASPVLEKFHAFLAASDTQYAVSGGGTEEITGEGVVLSVTFTETYQFKGGDCSDTTTSTVAGKATTQNTVLSGDYFYSRVDNGNWTKAARDSSAICSLSVVMDPALAFFDKGVETKNGAQLHRLEVADQVRLGKNMDALGRTNNKATLIFWTQDDGMPAAFQVSGSYDAALNSVPVHVIHTSDGAFTKTSGISVTAPPV